MSTEIVSDKICPHCGGNEWYTDYITYKEREKVYDRKRKLREMIKKIEPGYTGKAYKPVEKKEEQMEIQRDEMTYAEVIEKVSALGTQIQELYIRISGLISEHNKYVELLKFETL